MSEIKTPFSKERKSLHDLLPLRAPLRVEIDPCDVCNLRCDFCFQDKVNNKDYCGHLMDVELFERIICQLKEFGGKPIKKVYLYALGEPLLHPNIADFVARLKQTHVAEIVAITTNGTKITRDLSDDLINAGLDQISISVNGICDEDFMRICHTSVNFENYISNIRYLYEHKKECYVHVKLEGDYFSDDEQKRFYELFEECCDTMHIDKVADIWPEVEIEASGNLYGLQVDDDKPICPQPFYDICIHTDGTVTPCCAIWDYKKYNFGNIKEMSLVDIWNGFKYKQLCIEQIKGNKCSFDICNRCKFAEFGASVDLSKYRKNLREKYNV